jgi:primosomal protein N' (replication factor Y)
VHLVGVTGPVARALATWTQPAYARAELVDRAPPHAADRAGRRGRGSPVAVQSAAARPRSGARTGCAAILGPVPQEADPRNDGGVRALVRFDYALGRVVAESLRASVVADARQADRGPEDRSAARTTLRVRLDVPELDL